MLELIAISEVNDALAEMVAFFRVELRSYKGIVSKPYVDAGREEMEEYLAAGFPVFAGLVDGQYAGYVVCRVDNEVVWVESIFVKEEYRRHGVASALHSKAEEIAASYGEETVYNYVHPNNHRMIEFLRKRGYTVLNLIEIRKPYKGENLTQAITVGNHEFDY
ncbi:MAG: GNAT family N-acetyltransferase [Bacteroidales bacterium]|nr:GNAT family N-acetyltransferase [Bacteroidales bacterium]